MSSQFIHLHCHSAFSLLEGAIKPKDLVKLCVANKMPALAITDTNNMFGSLELSEGLSKAGVQPIMGCQLDFVPMPQEGMRTHHIQLKPEPIVLLAQNEQGYSNLLKIASNAYTKPEFDGTPLLEWEVLKGKTEGVIALSGGQSGPLIQRILKNRNDVVTPWLEEMMELFPNRFYLEIQRHGTDEQAQSEPEILKIAAQHNLPIVATNDVYFATRKMHQAHDALMCIADGAYVSQSDRRKVTQEHYFKSTQEMCELFADLPEAIENTVNIAKRCSYMSPAREPILPRFGDIDEEIRQLKEQSEAGLQKRLESHVFKSDMDEATRVETAKKYTDRLDYELGVINGMGFPGYFLIVSDFIEWTKDNGIPVGPGRGSGAGSVVAWALLITDLDPLRYGLLFERFLNPERVSMPDFDIDFCQDRRDEVIRYVQERYGAQQVAQIITFGKLQARAVLRDVGRVMQLSYGQVDRICKLVPNNPAAPVTLQEAIDQEPTLRSAIREEEEIERMVEVALQLEGLYRHASTNAAGVVIGDRPLVELLPLYRDPRSDMLVVQYSMKYAEGAGLVKFDFLGLKTLSVLQTARDFIAKNEGVELDLLQLPEGDEATYKMLGEGDATGVFQLESSGMRDTLRKLKPDTLEDIIALVSLYRPGPMDNIPTYIARKHGREEATYLHPSLEKYLKETFGVMIYQEQVMQIAQDLASYSLGEADLLRRAMGKKIAAEMEAQRALFTERAIANGVKEATAKDIFDLMAKFASYGFNKSHAAAYALIAYQTAYLKANYPAEFIAASMTYDIQNTEKLAIFAEDAKGRDIEVLPPCINYSFADFRTEKADDKKAVRYALGALKNVGRDAMEVLIVEREANGKFTDIFDMVTRVDSKVLNKRQMENLIRSGAFDCLNENRRQLIESLEKTLSFASAEADDADSGQDSLFAAAPEEMTIPKPIMADVPDWTKTERLNEEFVAIGFFLSGHPLAGYVPAMEGLRRTTAANLVGRLGSDYSAVKLAGIVGDIKYKRSQKGRFAFVGLSDETATFEVSIFDEKMLDEKRDILQSGNMVVVIAEGKQDDSGIRLIAKNVVALEEALKAPKIGVRRTVQSFEVSDSTAVIVLKEALAEFEKELGQPISINVVVNAEESVTILLAKRYELTLQDVERIEQRLAHAKQKAA